MPKIGFKHSDETKEKMRQAKLKNPTRYWLGKKMSEEHVQRSKEARKGLLANENNPAWKGEDAGYTSKHQWIARHFGKPGTCEFCGRSELSGKSIDWANISGEYRRDRNDWIRLCKPCHVGYDDTINRGWVTRRRNLQF